MSILAFDMTPDQYADYYPTFLWTGNDVPIDLTGCTARMMVRANPFDAIPMLSISTTPSSTGSIVLGGKAGTVQVNIIKGQMNNVALLAAANPAKPPRYDLLIDWPNGQTTELLSGQFLVDPGNTH